MLAHHVGTHLSLWIVAPEHITRTHSIVGVLMNRRWSSEFNSLILKDATAEMDAIASDWIVGESYKGSD